MKKYRKKPIVIEAEQWLKVTYDKEAGHGFGQESLPIYHLGVGYFRHPNKTGQGKCSHCDNIMHVHGWIDTLEGGHTVCPGDWIIKGIKGEFYPIKDDIFQECYEEVE